MLTRIYYQRLGLAESASKADVKQAYKRKAFELHPDRNQGSDTTEAFRLVVEAYDVLSSLPETARWADPVRDFREWTREQDRQARAQKAAEDTVRPPIVTARGSRKRIVFIPSGEHLLEVESVDRTVTKKGAGNPAYRVWFWIKRSNSLPTLTLVCAYFMEHLDFSMDRYRELLRALGVTDDAGAERALHRNSLKGRVVECTTTESTSGYANHRFRTPGGAAPGAPTPKDPPPVEKPGSLAAKLREEVNARRNASAADVSDKAKEMFENIRNKSKPRW